MMARFYSLISFLGFKSSLFYFFVLNITKRFCYAQKTWNGLVKYIRPHRIFKLDKCAYFTLLLISMHSWVFMATPCAIKSVFIHWVNWSSRLKPSLFVLCPTEEKHICNVLFDHDERHRLCALSCLEWSHEPWIYYLIATKPGDTGVFLNLSFYQLRTWDWTVQTWVYVTSNTVALTH